MPTGALGNVWVQSLPKLWGIGEGRTCHLLNGSWNDERVAFHSPKVRSCFGKVILNRVKWRGRTQEWCHPGWLSSSGLSCQSLTAFASVPGNHMGRWWGGPHTVQERGSDRLESWEEGHAATGVRMCCCPRQKNIIKSHHSAQGTPSCHTVWVPILKQTIDTTFTSQSFLIDKRIMLNWVPKWERCAAKWTRIPKTSHSLVYVIFLHLKKETKV